MYYLIFFLMILRTPRSTRTDTLFPYTTLFRSLLGSNLPCQGMSRNISDPTRISTYDACAEPTPSGPATSVLVARAFKNLTIPSSQIVIQPPDGTTLVNMDTLFSTQAEQYDQSLTLQIGRANV